jgi:hypothetical protein
VNEKLWAEEEKKGLKPIEEKSKEEKPTNAPSKRKNSKKSVSFRLLLFSSAFGM